MEEKKKSNGGLIVLIIILLLACIGMGAFIFMNKDKIITKDNSTVEKEKNTNKEEVNNNTEEPTNDIFKDETIHSYYYETKQEGTVKYFMTLINSTNDNTQGYFTLRYVSVFDSGSEGPLTSGYYKIVDGKLKLTIGPYTNDGGIIEEAFNQLSANLEVDPEQDWRNSPNAPSYYKMYVTTYNENELTIGNKTFYKAN